ncbi:hypothetical protein DXD89_08520 [Butyricicoccus sp. TM10-16AC]|nr:hypothetical protein DWZ82_07925 [Butyricicoccus sp. AF35-5AC]RHU18205.1 hypothetical protein DXD89_08520 [Butyricicoccus sp. TM10-16AC]
MRDDKLSFLHRNSLSIIIINIHRKIKQVLLSTRIMFISTFGANNRIIFVDIIFFDSDHLRTIGIETLKYFIKSLSINMMWAILTYFI